MKNSSASGLVEPPSAEETAAARPMLVRLHAKKKTSRQRLRTMRSCGISTKSSATTAKKPNSEAIVCRLGWSQVAAQ